MRMSFFQSQRKGSNQEAKEFLALIDLYTELQQELLEAREEEEDEEYEEQLEEDEDDEQLG